MRTTRARVAFVMAMASFCFACKGVGLGARFVDLFPKGGTSGYWGRAESVDLIQAYGLPHACRVLAPAPETPGGAPMRTVWCGGGDVRVFDPKINAWRERR
jgi:hypothetical protein